MPRRKRIDKRKAALTPTQWEFLCDVETIPDNFERWVLDEDCSPFFTVRDLWEEQRDEVLSAYIADNPGSRPSLWWKYDAPEEPDGSETEAMYLKRHCLFLPGERKRLRKEDFESEQVIT
jgi:hypothetical protein